MSQTFQPGYLVSVTIDADTVIGLTANSYDNTYGPNTLAKATFGKAFTDGAAGVGVGTVSLAGHSTDEALPLLAALRDQAGQPVAIEVTYPTGASTGAKDAFSAILRVGVSATADGEVDWTLDGDLTTAITFTPETP